MPQLHGDGNTWCGIHPRSSGANLAPRHLTPTLARKLKRDPSAHKTTKDVTNSTPSARSRRAEAARVTTLQDLDHHREDTADKPAAHTPPGGTTKLHFSVYRGQTLFEPHCWGAPDSIDTSVPHAATPPTTTAAEPVTSHAATAAQAGVEPAVIEALFAATSQQQHAIVRSTQRDGQRTLDRPLHVPDAHALGRLRSSHGGYRRRTGPSAVAITQLMAGRSHRLLTREEEVALVQQVHAGLVEGAAREAIARSEEARQTLLLHNVRLVLSLAGSFRRRLGGAGAHVSLDDLVAAGVEGMSKGIDRFDLQRGVKLATYCYYHMLSCMIDLLYHAFAEQHGRNASPQELQAVTNLPAKAMPRLLNVRALVPVALEASAPDDEACDLHCRLVDPGNRSWTAVAVDRLRDETVSSLVRSLPDREALALQLVYGLGSTRPMPYKEAAVVMGVSKQRVGQLVIAGRKRLRMRLHELRSADSSGEWAAVLDTVVPAT